MSVSFYLSQLPRQVTHLEDSLSEGERLLGGGVRGWSSLHCLSQYKPEATRDSGVQPPLITAHLRAHTIKGHSARCNIARREFPEKLDLRCKRNWKLFANSNFPKSYTPGWLSRSIHIRLTVIYKLSGFSFTWLKRKVIEKLTLLSVLSPCID